MQTFFFILIPLAPALKESHMTTTQKEKFQLSLMKRAIWLMLFIWKVGNTQKTGPIMNTTLKKKRLTWAEGEGW